MRIVGSRENRNTAIQLEQLAIQCHAEEINWLIAFVGYCKRELELEQKYLDEHGLQENSLHFHYQDWRQGWSSGEHDLILRITSECGYEDAPYSKKEQLQSLSSYSDFSIKLEKIGREEDAALDAQENNSCELDERIPVLLVKSEIVCHENELNNFAAFLTFAKDKFLLFIRECEIEKTAVCPQIYHYKDWSPEWTGNESDLTLILSPKETGTSRLIAAKGYKDKEMETAFQAYFEQ